MSSGKQEKVRSELVATDIWLRHFESGVMKMGLGLLVGGGCSLIVFGMKGRFSVSSLGKGVLTGFGGGFGAGITWNEASIQFDKMRGKN